MKLGRLFGLSAKSTEGGSGKTESVSEAAGDSALDAVELAVEAAVEYVEVPKLPVAEEIEGLLKSALGLLSRLESEQRARVAHKEWCEERFGIAPWGVEAKTYDTDEYEHREAVRNSVGKLTVDLEKAKKITEVLESLLDGEDEEYRAMFEKDLEDLRTTAVWHSERPGWSGIKLKFASRY